MHHSTIFIKVFFLLLKWNMETKLQSRDDLASTLIWNSYDLKCCFVMANSRGTRQNIWHPGKLLLLKSSVHWCACIQYFNIQVSNNQLRESSNLCCLIDCLLTFTGHQEQGSFAFFYCFENKKLLICRKVQIRGIDSPNPQKEKSFEICGSKMLVCILSNFGQWLD